MKFLSPSILFALFALAIPIIIHLFSFRKFKKVLFPDVRFLKEIRQEKRTSSRLRHLLVLISRLLFLTFLIFAFAQPFIPGPEQNADNTGPAVVSVFVDNSFSMNASGEGGRMLDIARSKAREVVMAYPASGRFQLLTHDFKAEHQDLLTREAFLDLLDQVEETPASKTVGEVIVRQQDFLARESTTQKDLFIISDFQESFSRFAGPTPDSTVSVFLVPVEANDNPNLYIDSVWFESPVRSPEGAEKITALVKNPGSATAENVPVQLFVNGTQKSPSSISVPAGGSAEISISYSQSGPGIKSGQLSLQDHPVTYDDDFFFSYTVKDQIRVLVVNGSEENAFINSFIQTETYFKADFTGEKNIDYSSFGSYNVIILNELSEAGSGLTSSLKSFTEQGGHLVIFPDVDKSPEVYNPLLETFNLGAFTIKDTADFRLTAVDENHEIFQGVFEKSPDPLSLPIVRERFRISESRRGKITPILYGGQQGLFLGSADRGAGRVYLFTAPARLSAGNFPQHALFAPVMYKIILSSQRSGDLYGYLGDNEPVKYQGELSGQERTVRVREPEGNFEMIPEIYPSGGTVFLNFHNAIPDAGNYLVLSEEQAVQGVSLNYNRAESNLTYIPAKDLEEAARDEGVTVRVIDKAGEKLGQQITQMNQGKPLWKYCLWLALLFLLLEIILLRLGTRTPKLSKASNGYSD